MKQIKKVISILLCIAFITSVFSACSTINPDNVEGNLTKGSWVNLLSSHFGLDNEKDSEPYFKDVTKGNEIYDSVQACANWGIINDAVHFRPEKKVNREYVFASAVRAIGPAITKVKYDESDKKCAQAAVDLGLADNSSWLYMHEGVNEEEATKIAKNAAILFCGNTIVEHDNSKLTDGVKVQENTEGIVLGNSSVSVSDSANVQYEIGDIVVLGSGKDMRQLKIVGATKENGQTVYQYEQPTIDEVYDVIDVGGTGVLEDVSDIHCAPGVTLKSVDEVELVNSFREVAVQSLGLANGQTETKDAGTKFGSHLSFDISFGSDGLPKTSVKMKSGNGSFGVKGDSDEKADNSKYDITKTENGKPVDTSGVEIDKDTMYSYEEKNITEYANGNKKTVTTGKDYKAGWKVKGSIEVSDLIPSVDVKTKKVGPVITGFESFEYECNPSVTGQIGIEGYVSFDKTVMEVDYAVGPLVVGVAFNIGVTLNGEVTFTVSVTQKNKVTYDQKNGFKKVCSTEMDKTLDFDATLTITPVELSFKIKIGWFTLIDLSVSASVEFSLKLSGTWFVYSKEGMFKMGGDEAKLEDARSGFLFCREYKMVFPIVELEIGSKASLLGKLGMSYTWKIVAEKDGVLQSKVLEAHCEGKALNKVSQCTLDSMTTYDYENAKEVLEDPNSGAVEDEPEVDDYLFEVDTYSVTVEEGKTAKINVSKIPKGYSFGDIKVTSNDNKTATVNKLTANIDATEGTIVVEGKKSGTATLTVKLGKSKARQITVIVL